MRLEEIFTPISFTAYETKDGYVWHHFENYMVMFFPSVPVLAEILDSPIFIKAFVIDDKNKSGNPDIFKTFRANPEPTSSRYLALNELEQAFGKYKTSYAKNPGAPFEKKRVLAESQKPGFLY